MPLKAIYSKAYEVEIREHPWQINKYKEVHQRALKDNLVLKTNLVLFDEEAVDEDLLLVHTDEFVEKLQFGDFTHSEILRMELPLSMDLIRFFKTSARGTMLACEEALKTGAAYHVGGGFHHAFPDYGSGFCLVHDVAIGIRKLQQQKKVKRPLVVDLDVHQGDGTAFIFQEDDSIFTFSMHQENNFPYPKQKSDLDIGLDNGAGDKEYLVALKKHLPEIIKKHKPDFLMYVAGADPYEQDLLGGLKISLKGLKERDQFVIEQAVSNRIPFVVTLAGGYARDPLDTVTIHYNTLQVAALAVR